MSTRWVVQKLWCVILLLLVTGCAGPRAFKAAEALRQEGRYDAAVAKFAEAVEHSPDNLGYRMSLSKARNKAALAHQETGRTLLATEQYPEAALEFRQALALDPSLTIAVQELKHIELLLQVERLVSEAEEFFRLRRLHNAKNNLHRALEIDPGNAAALALLAQVQQSGNVLMDGFELDIISEQPITLTFKAAKTKEVFNVLSKLSGIHFIFDEELKEENISLSLENATFAQALELLLRMNDLGKKVLNSKTIIIYSNSKEKSKQYDDQLIQTFYLSNIEAKKAVNLLRTMLQLRKIYVHEELNALVLRDRPEVIRLAQQILEAADRSDSEVILDLELVEVTHNGELKIGPNLSTYSVSLGMGAAGAETLVADALSAGGETSGLIKSLNHLQTFYTLPTATFEARKKLTDSETLANPSIRVKNREKAKVHIGSREPVITVTINGDQTSENIQYVDVGVKLDVEPSIQLDNTVVTKLNLEVSNATRLTALTSGTTPLQISTTNASTTLILKNGEQTIIGGLLRDDESKNRSTLPLLGDIPLLGQLFSGHNNSHNKREILLSITPHIVKNLDLPEATVASIWSGGEDELRVGPNFGSFRQFEPELETPLPLVAPGKASVAEAVPVFTATVAEDETGAPESDEISTIIQNPTELPAAEETVATGSDEETVLVERMPPASLGATAAAATQTARLYFSGPDQIGSGEEFVLEAYVEGVSDLFSAPLMVTYDSSKLALLRAEEGDLLKQEGQATLFSTSASPGKGEIFIASKQAQGGTGASGSGCLFRLHFSARSTGSADIAMERTNFRTTTGAPLAVGTSPFTLAVR